MRTDLGRAIRHAEPASALEPQDTPPASPALSRAPGNRIVLEARKAEHLPFAPVAYGPVNDDNVERLVGACFRGNEQVRWSKYQITYVWVGVAA